MIEYKVLKARYFLWNYAYDLDVFNDRATIDIAHKRVMYISQILVLYVSLLTHGNTVEPLYKGTPKSNMTLNSTTIITEWKWLIV